jgi:hypothetical protein
VSYHASAVKIYNALSSLVRFENKIFPFFCKNALCSLLHTTLAFLCKNALRSLLQRWRFSAKTLYVVYYNAGVVVLNSEVIGLAPGMNPRHSDP